MIVHLLHHGYALCGRGGIPASWNADERWIGALNMQTNPELVWIAVMLVCPPCSSTFLIWRP